MLAACTRLEREIQLLIIQLRNLFFPLFPSAGLSAICNILIRPVELYESTDPWSPTILVGLEYLLGIHSDSDVHGLE
jgi:hypothetical protein